MTAIVAYFNENIFYAIGKRISNAFHVSGYLRAAAELSRIGYTEEAKKCVEMANEYKRK